MIDSHCHLADEVYAGDAAAVIARAQAAGVRAAMCILDATDELAKSDPNKQAVGKLMDEFYSLPPGTGGSMLADAHWTNYAENRDFFLVASNPTNFERTYDTAYRLYKAIRVLENEKVPFDKIMDFSVIKKLGAEPKYAESKNEYEFKFTPASGSEVSSACSSGVLRLRFRRVWLRQELANARLSRCSSVSRGPASVL